MAKEGESQQWGVLCDGKTVSGCFSFASSLLLIAGSQNKLRYLFKFPLQAKAKPLAILFEDSNEGKAIHRGNSDVWKSLLPGGGSPSRPHAQGALATPGPEQVPGASEGQCRAEPRSSPLSWTSQTSIAVTSFISAVRGKHDPSRSAYFHVSTSKC